MKKYVAAAGLLLGCMGNAAAQPIFGGPPLLSDPELQQCLEETALSESWTQTEQVTHLACADRNIESASGLDNFPDLTSLDLSGNALMSAAGMHSLTGLVQLLLSDNAGMDINDIAPILANNTGLTHLGLAGITIEYLSQLPLYNSQTSNHYDLIELDISRTGITDLGYLMNFPSLQRLDVSGNAIGEIFPWYLESLTQLTAIDLSDNALSSVQGLDFHTGLIELNLSNNADLEIYDVIPILANNVGLAQIGLGGIDIADFYQLPLNNPQTSSTYQLVELDLSRTGITDVNRLYEFPNLRRLNLSGNGISNINPWLLEQLTQLTAIDLSDNALNSVQGLDFHTSLTELNLSNNAGLELYAILPILAYNTGLTHIGLGGIAITDLNQLPLYNAQTNSTYRLFELDVSHTGISNTARLYEFPNLRRLDLSGNQLTDISSGIDQMPGLTALDLSDNRLTYLPWLNGLRQLTELNLSNNTGIEFNQVVPVIASNTRLTHLGLGGIALTDLYQIPLNDPYKLLELDVSHTGINNTARLYEFRNLERLDLSGNQLTDIGSGIDQMPGLTALDLSDNRLTYLPGLNGLQRLTELNLSNN
ncbi:MAG: leucine-rich repeat domain-containing protein, partial [Gammaproteobacteria bacterium]|nr:leucine-rich repeat domain-containing protein [Gammaproteobacteria bacterium]